MARIDTIVHRTPDSAWGMDTRPHARNPDGAKSRAVPAYWVAGGATPCLLEFGRRSWKED